jgi:hypothetical protein
MESSAVFTQVQGDTVVISTASGRRVTVELGEGQGAVLSQRDDAHLLGDLAELIWSMLKAVDAMIAAPNEVTVCQINHAFEAAARRAVGALAAANATAEVADDDGEVDGYYDPDDDLPLTQVFDLLGFTPALTLVRPAPTGILVVEQP